MSSAIPGLNIFFVGIAKTDIIRHSNFLFKIAVGLVGKSPEAAVKNFVYLASDPEVNFSGYFLKKPGNHSVKEKNKYDADIAERLWNVSMELIKPILDQRFN